MRLNPYVYCIATYYTLALNLVHVGSFFKLICCLQQYIRSMAPTFVYRWYGSHYMRHSRERLLYRKAQGTLVSQLKNKHVM